MKLFLTSLIGVALLIPIVYFVPLHLNRQLKFSLIVSSFGLAVLGSLVLQFPPISSTAPILFLLAIIAAYFIGKRAVEFEAAPPQQEAMDVQWARSEEKSGSTEPIQVEPTLATELTETQPSIFEDGILDTEEIEKVEPVDITRDSLSELEDELILKELPQRVLESETIFSEHEPSEEGLLKERNLLFEVLEEEPSFDQEKEKAPSSTKDH